MTTPWTAARVAPERTHHCDERGAPLYAERFTEALSFHAPGLAAVRRDDLAWHIDLSGRPAYTVRFARTFGFYEGLAAVVDAEGCFFVTPDGAPAGPERYAWCGNYQDGRATVRDHDGAYFHVGRAGAPAYAQRWAYAGDFVHGIAVVSETHATHIDRDGHLVHGRWFVDLDVFHKGFARARDAGGWMHVDLRGSPIYGRRFAAVEPFYNGQARVERLDGAVEIIDEHGATLRQLRAPQSDPFHALSADLVGAWRGATIAAAIALGLPAALPAELAELARRCRLPQPQARRLLRALAELQVVEEQAGTWALSARGQHLRREHPESLAEAAVAYQGELFAPWRALPEALRSPRWRPPDIFAAAAEDPERTRRHHQIQQAYAAHDYREVVRALTLPTGARIVDAGGGTGELARLLATRDPTCMVTILERPEVAARVPRGARVSARAADLFAPWQVRADVVVLARVLHDWDDDDAAAILRRARAALQPGGQLVVIELLLDERGPAGGLCDLHLMLACGGRERTLVEFTALITSAGFTAPAHTPVLGVPQILQAVAR